MPKTRTTKAKPRKRKPVPSWFMKQWGFVRCSGGLYRARPGKACDGCGSSSTECLGKAFAIINDEGIFKRPACKPCVDNGLECSGNKAYTDYKIVNFAASLRKDIRRKLRYVQGTEHDNEVATDEAWKKAAKGAKRARGTERDDSAEGAGKLKGDNDIARKKRVKNNKVDVHTDEGTATMATTADLLAAIAAVKDVAERCDSTVYRIEGQVEKLLSDTVNDAVTRALEVADLEVQHYDLLRKMDEIERMVQVVDFDHLEALAERMEMAVDKLSNLEVPLTAIIKTPTPQAVPVTPTNPSTKINKTILSDSDGSDHADSQSQSSSSSDSGFRSSDSESDSDESVDLNHEPNVKSLADDHEADADMDIDEQLNGTALPVLRVMLNSGPSSIDNPFQGITVDNAHSTASGSEINKTNKKRKTRTRKSKSNTSAYTPEEMALNEPDGEDLTVFN